jgi:NAD(P)-dependent dehydrogenase (short-subunit alcohol dehydrogenase family)
LPVSLLERVALVTGAGRGVGRSIAMDLARHGAKVIVNDLGGTLDGEGDDLSVAQQVAQEIEEAGGTAIANTGDVTSYEDAYSMIKQAIDTWGRLDILVSNAGILRDRALHNLPEGDWLKVLDVHLNGGYNLLHHAWPVFRQQHYGRVILTTSNSGFLGNFGQSNYAAAKAGLIGLMNVAKLEGDKYNVMVNCLNPGAATRMTTSVREVSDEQMAAMSPDLVAPAVTYMASDSCTTSGMIITSASGSFGRAAIVQNERVAIPNATADDVEAQWDEITSLENAEVWWSVRETRAAYEAAKQE